jgi:hypothetical protein
MAAEARDDWALSADAAALEIKNCAKELRQEAVRQFVADAANSQEPHPSPLNLLRRYMANAHRHCNPAGETAGGQMGGYAPSTRPNGTLFVTPMGTMMQTKNGPVKICDGEMPQL